MTRIPQPRGRPPLADVSSLRLRTLTILMDRGYENVTMSSLASEVGLSVRTLHRYFPTKADIAWGGLEGSVEALRRGFDSADDTLDVGESVTEVVTGLFDEHVDDWEVTRVRLRLIATSPELQAARSETYRLWREETVRYVARRLDSPADHVIPRAVGAAIQVAIMEALAWWAQTMSGTHPAIVVTQTLRGLTEGLAVGPTDRPASKASQVIPTRGEIA
ncbi:TetR family transcriptional regulator [Rhodococcus sp. 15-649-1-2]|nr:MULTISPECIES: TetR family transcriptional regulator [unclassified Rhodococcus (in: high G+C Gram-positive bacteria)]OZC76309.1 TetR family transcriptional regulator [Rhodococcus sp. 06-418-1B]OZE80160.1 TetR family transcriptional regulator [Rhodococcus sp. 15-649-1-2]